MGGSPEAVHLGDPRASDASPPNLSSERSTEAPVSDRRSAPAKKKRPKPALGLRQASPDRKQGLSPEEKTRVLALALELSRLGPSPAEFLHSAVLAEKAAAGCFVQKAETLEGRVFDFIEVDERALQNQIRNGVGGFADPLYSPSILDHIASLRRSLANVDARDAQRKEPVELLKYTSAALTRLANVIARPSARRKRSDRDRWDYGTYQCIQAAMSARLGIPLKRTHTVKTPYLMELGWNPTKTEEFEPHFSSLIGTPIHERAALVLLALIWKREGKRGMVQVNADETEAEKLIWRLEQSLRRTRRPIQS